MMRKLSLLVLAACVVSCSTAALLVAETPEDAAQKAAMTWLALVDAGQYGESWTAASEAFKAAVSRAQWVGALEKVRAPLGKVVSRKLKAAKFMRDLPGAPAGEYVVIQYDTDFEKESGATERITPMKDKDGAWRVSGYYIK